MIDRNISVRDLRRLWKPAKLRLQAIRPDDPTVIRIHRCCSWLARVESLADETSDDLALISRWIALNSLYGRWDSKLREARPDRSTLGDFTTDIVEADRNKRVHNVLVQHKPLVMAILDDEYLAKYYWEDPSIERAMKTKKAVIDARKAYQELRFGGVLWRILDRIYLLRCQLVHGAATAGGSLNRTALKRCNMMLAHLLPAIVLVFIDNGEDHDWGVLCYPPRKR
jgi:hypothetical protein